MTRPDWIEELRADLRPADPDPVLLAQLVELSRGSVAPAPRPGRSAGARLAIVLGGAIAVGATSWAAGALPGTESTFGPEEHVTHQPTDPTPGNVGTPQPDESEPPVGDPSRSPSGGPRSPDAPGRTGGPPGAPLETPSGVPGEPPSKDRGRNGDPPGPSGGLPGAPDLPGLPGLPHVPDLPDVPPVSVPPGLDRVPDLSDTAKPPGPVGPSRAPSPDTLIDDDPVTDSDSGSGRSPRPQEAQVADER